MLLFFKDDEDDIFGATKASSKKATTKDENLFKDDTDIFADIPAVKPKEKKNKKAAGKSLFKDDDIGKCLCVERMPTISYIIVPHQMTYLPRILPNRKPQSRLQRKLPRNPSRSQTSLMMMTQPVYLTTPLMH
jgi:hypothetical protein